jgi:hypothetical protein
MNMGIVQHQSLYEVTNILEPHLAASDGSLSQQQASLYYELFVSNCEGYYYQYRQQSKSNGPDASIRWKRGNHLTWDKLLPAINGKQSLALILSDKFQRAKCLGIDVDSRDQEKLRQLQGLIHLEWDVPITSIHVARSGGKGYHFWICFDDPIPIHDLRGAVERLRNAAKLDGIGFDYVAPLEKKHLRAPLSLDLRTNKRVVFIDENYHPYQDQGAYLSVIARSRIDGSKLVFPSQGEWDGKRKKPDCIQYFETHDLIQPGVRRKLLWGLICCWISIDNTKTEDQVLALAENWYSMYYKVGRTSLEEHLSDTSYLYTELADSPRFNCQEYPEIYQEHCGPNCPGARLRRLYVPKDDLYPFSSVWRDLPKDSFLIYSRMRALSEAAKKKKAPSFSGFPVFFVIQDTLANGNCDVKTVRKILKGLKEKRLIRQMTMGWLRKHKDFQRDNGHLKHGKQSPHYYVVPDFPTQLPQSGSCKDADVEGQQSSRSTESTSEVPTQNPAA